MNERIRELAIESEMYVDLNGKPWPKWMTAEECEVAYDKFAKLIVGECAVWIENATVTDSAGNKDHIGDSFFWADKLKKHFGV